MPSQVMDRETLRKMFRVVFRLFSEGEDADVAHSSVEDVIYSMSQDELVHGIRAFIWIQHEARQTHVVDAPSAKVGHVCLCRHGLYRFEDLYGIDAFWRHGQLV